ncbi:MAG TPA: alpha/beta hydrolase [Thermoflexales bacterium]|nr:alpha/beta hydrolase [Thermoflexales bacterium]
MKLRDIPYLMWVAGLALIGCQQSNAPPTPATLVEAPGPFEAQIDLDGRGAHIWCYGRGSPTVIYESWLGALGESALPLIIRVGSVMRVCVYDRANVPGGRSDAAPYPRTSLDMVDDLHLLLDRAHIPPPYLLVGDSFGAMNAILFAHKHRSEVTAVALIEPLAPGALTSMLAAIPPQTEDESPGVGHARRRIVGLLTNNSEGIDLTASEAQIRGIGRLDDLPVLILQAEFPLTDWLPCDGAAHIAVEQAWRRQQGFYSKLSTRTSVVSISGGHDLLGDDPDAVATAVRGLITGK